MSRRSRVTRTIALASVIALILVACGGASSKRYPIRPAEHAPNPEQALTIGAFHARVINGQACAGVGAHLHPMVWPKGWQVELDPVRLVDPAGDVVAREGQTVYIGGGASPKEITTPCGHFTGTWFVHDVSTHAP